MTDKVRSNARSEGCAATFYHDCGSAQNAADYASPKHKPLCAARETECASWKSPDKRRIRREQHTNRVPAVDKAVIAAIGT